MILKIHREGISIIAMTGILLLLINLILFVFSVFTVPVLLVILVLSVLFLVFVLRFFRVPARNFLSVENAVYSPADGTVVAIEEVYEPEYFKDNRLLVSVFMSVWNVHINWCPVSGIVKYFRYHPGKYLVARHPKSSELNERTSMVLKDEKGREVLVRQIAGIVARRVVYYTGEGLKVNAGEEYGFIKFGSRLDVYLPLSAEVKVKLKEKVKGKYTLLAIW